MKRGHKYRVDKLGPRLDIRKYYFTYMVVNNSLPELNSQTIKEIENKLDKF